MLINKDILKEKNACQDGILWYQENFGDVSTNVCDVIKKLEEQKNSEGYIFWLFVKLNLTGVCRDWCKNGQLKFEGNFKDGKEDGKQRSWYENGQLRYEGNFKDGKLVGEGRGWYENGQLKYEGNYRNGGHNGRRRWWYENGQLRWEENYRNGKPVGWEK